METDTTIEKIKALEDWSKKEVEKAEKGKAAIIQKARERAILIVEEFEKTKGENLENKMSEANEEVKKESAKISAKAQKSAEDIREKALGNSKEITRKFFDKFRKELLL